MLPYDIIKNSDEKFVIKMAVAGYTKDQISVKLDDGKLIVTGKIIPDESKKDSGCILSGSPSTPGRTTPNSGQSDAADRLGGCLRNAGHRRPSHRRGTPLRPRRRTYWQSR